MSDPTHSAADSNQSGYVLATTALLLIPLMIFAAFAVDVGAWYVEADQAQRAADSASLAAVVRMPDEPNATQAAFDVAASNGYTDQPGCTGTVADCRSALEAGSVASPQVLVIPTGTQSVKVHVLTNADSYFGQVVLDNITLDRFASARYILPVPMGNPTNVLGGGSELIEGSQSNYYLRAMTECENRRTGDFIGAGGGCTGTGYDPGNPDAGNTNPNHVDEGHKFIIDIPGTGSWELQARLTCAEAFGSTQANAPMRFTLYPGDNTDLDDQDNLLLPILTTVTVQDPTDDVSANCDDDGDGNNDWAWDNEPAPWVTIQDNMTIDGHYVMFAKNTAYDANRRTLYSLRVVPTGTASNASWTCSRIGATPLADCPNLWAESFLTTYTHTDMFDPAVSSQFSELFLAEVAEVHAGKRMEVVLFDPADGIENMKILDPSGVAQNLEWWTIDCAEYNYPTVGCTGDYGSPASPITQTCGTDPCLKQEGAYSFQDKTVKLFIDIPTNYACEVIVAQPDNCWWTVEYETSGTASETTTWGVRIIGDPVRLTE